MKGSLKWKATIFDITINTNKSLMGASQEKIEELKDALEKYIRTVFNERQLYRLFINKNKEKIPLGNLRNLTVKSVIEANLHGRSFLHSHTMIRVEHDVAVRINIEVVKSTLYKFLQNQLTINGDFKKPYVNVKALQDTSYNMQNYIKNENREAEFIKEI